MPDFLLTRHLGEAHALTLCHLKRLLVWHALCTSTSHTPDGAADILEGHLPHSTKPDPNPSQLSTQMSKN